MNHKNVGPQFEGQSQSAEKVQQVQDLRRSGASGSHGKRSKDRANNRRKAIEDSRRDS